MKTEKNELRKKFSDARRNMSSAYRKKADAAICDMLSRVEELNECEVVAAYMSDGTEPELGKYVRYTSEFKGKRFCFPRHRNGAYEMAYVTNCDIDFVKGKYGLLEPRPKMPVASVCRENLVWLVPGVAFDLSGGRLGRGKSVYDRLLGGSSGFKIGVFYESQKCDSVPMEEHDCKMDMIVTEMGARRITERSGNPL